jgi:mannose-6-phosphate isomerase-like protein (cupin superfamily)
MKQPSRGGPPSGLPAIPRPFLDGIDARRLLCTILICFLLLTFPSQVNAETLNYRLPPFQSIPSPRRVLGPAGEHFTFLRTGKDTHGKFTIAKAIIPPGAGPIPHIHMLTDEWFYFPKGGITIFCDPKHSYSSIKSIPNHAGTPGANAEQVTTKDNSLYYGPHYYLHGFYNNTNQDLEVVFVWAAKPGEEGNPASDISDYFFSVGKNVQEFTPGLNPTNAEKVAFVTEAPRWGINQSSFFMQYLTSIGPAPQHSAFRHENDQTRRLEILLKTPIQAKR